jgi:hypothetical protein
VSELKYVNGEIVCDRDELLKFKLTAKSK